MGEQCIICHKPEGYHRMAGLNDEVYDDGDGHYYTTPSTIAQLRDRISELEAERDEWQIVKTAGAWRVRATAAEAQVTALQGEVEQWEWVAKALMGTDAEIAQQLTALRSELEQAQAMTTRHIRVSKELMADRDAEKGRAERAEAVLRDISGRLKGPAFGHPSSDYIATLADEALDAALTPPSSKAEARQQAQS